MKKLTLKNLSLSNKKILMRVDFNVPLSKQGDITDDSRIRAALPSIRYALDHNAAVILMSHLGRPSGPDPHLSLAPCARRLSELLGQAVPLAPDCIGPKVEKLVSQLVPGQILLLENLRFHPGEEHPEKDPSFVASLAKLGDAYVNDAFGTAHRAHASTALIASFFPTESAMGFLIEKELSFLEPLLNHPKRPFFALLGGAKISTKIGVIESLLKQVDALYLGGAMVFPFLKEKGISVGESFVEAAPIGSLLKETKLHFPLDLVIADSLSNEAKTSVIPFGKPIPAGWRGLDIGPETIERWSSEFKKAATFFWNGPVGAFEMPQFAKGTHGVAEALSKTSAKVIVGGGDSVAAVEQMGFGSRFTHLSTGGGASLEYLEFGHLPGIDALTNAL
jgi:phosphoglycerate kinase